MCYQALAIVCGIALFQFVPRLPDPLLYLTIIPAVWLLTRAPGFRIAGLIALGFLWAMWRAEMLLGARLEPSREGQVLSIVGTVTSRPVEIGAGKRFDFQARNATDPRGIEVPLSALKLAWYDRPLALSVRSQCSLKVRLKLPYGTRNPGSFDREKWMFTERIAATGYVVAHRANHCKAPSANWSLSRIRAAIAAHIRVSLPDPLHHGVVAALAVADRDALSQAQWQILRTTGTSHLLAISGLHISLIAGVGFVLAHWGIGLFAPVNRCWPVQRPAAFVALAVAFGYAALAGFPISTQRALVMLTVVMLCQILRRRSFSVDGFVVALTTVAIFDPPALLTASFWLSFSAVGWLLFINTVKPPTNILRRLLQMHFYLALGLTPLLGALHQSVPLASPLANLAAVPIVTLAIVPLVLAGVIAVPFNPSIATALWHAAAWVWDVLWAYLSILAEWLGPLNLPIAPQPWAIGLALAGVAVFVVPILSARWLLGTLLIAALAIEQRHAPSLAHLRLTVVDVGQGLAVVVETAHKVVVYDTGPAFGRFSAGADIIAPLLRARGIKSIDRLILSHSDADHAAGWPGLASALTVDEVWVNPGHLVTVPTTTCRAGQRWVWDGVEFEILSPIAMNSSSRNDRSCVLKITAPGGSVLLPGDIEGPAEARLFAQASTRLAADILIAPHHGSRTSSSGAFISAVDPSFVIFAAGYKNRFDFPRPQVVSRYVNGGAVVLTTGIEGAIEFNITDKVEAPHSYRRAHLRYWHHLAPSFETTTRTATPP